VHVTAAKTYYARKDSVSFKSVVPKMGCTTPWGGNKWGALREMGRALLLATEVGLNQIVRNCITSSSPSGTSRIYQQ
jgi:hypothetical protein